MITLSHAIRGLAKPATIRAFRTASISTQAHRLTSEGPYVRAFGNPDAGNLKGKENDFLYFPEFFNDAEQEILLKLALWKLDRVDSSRRRRRRRTGSAVTEEGNAAEKNGLQRMFEDSSAYGFEDVSWEHKLLK
jgi:alkylated DNA repair protein alkB family protein 7